MRRAVVLALFACGSEEEIIRVRPILSVCPTAVFGEACDRPIDLGDRPITVPLELDLFVHDRGEGALIVSAAAGAGVESRIELPFTVAAGTSARLPLSVTPSVLGPGTAVLAIESDDAERSPYELPLSYFGVPKPVPKLELCVGAATSTSGGATICGVDLVYDLGVVRRSQEESVIISVSNIGTAPLAILGVEVQGVSSEDGELLLVTSTRPGALEPGASAEVVVVYAPADGVADRVEVLFHTDDPDVPEARVVIGAASDTNLPPTADARQVDTGSTSVEIAVEDIVILDGAGSADPEGDPLAFEWVLSAPARSRAVLDDSTAGLVTFVPDVAGSYRVELVVSDSLGQRSEVAAVVLVDARPRFAFRAKLEWQGGGDLDLHFVGEGGALFGPDDCHFDNPRPDFGAPMVAEDDPELRGDVDAPPGGEEIVLEAPAPGIYALYVQVFDDLGNGASTAAVEVVFDDGSQPVFSATQSLERTCSLWHVGDFEVGPSRFTASPSPVGSQCR
jgi:hypothetical protein